MLFEKTGVDIIIDKAVNREKLELSEIVNLLELPENSLDIYKLMGGANYITRQLSGNQGIIGSQIGLNVEQCSKNCEFCSFGEKHGLIKKGYRLTKEQVEQKTKDFVEAGVNYISLMATADYPFEEYIKMSEVARKVMPPEMMLSANLGDFGVQEAKQLKGLGFGRVYHVIRLGEGQYTDINPKDRIKTIEAAAGENLEIAFCIEPIGIEHTSLEIAEKIQLSLEFKPTTCAVMRRVPIAGTAFAKYPKVSEVRMAHIMAVLRLAYAYTDTKAFYVHEPSLPGLMAGANLICAETAGNPREVVENGESIRGYTVARCRDLLNNAGFEQRSEANYPGTWYKGYKRGEL